MAKAKKSNLLEALLEQIKHKNTSPEILAGAWHLAIRQKDVEAMAAIAAADNLPDSVLTAVKARVEIPVAVSYLTRGGLDIEERRARFRAEERAGVLAGCLESPGLTEDDREIIGAKLVAKPTRALAEATVKAGNMPAAAAVVAIAQLDSRTDSLTEEVRRALRNQVLRLANDDQYAGEVSKVLTNRELTERFLSKQPKISEEEFTELFKRALEEQIVSLSDQRHGGRYIYRISGMLRNIIGDDQEYMNVPMIAALRRHLDNDTVAKVWTEVAGATKAATETADTSGYSQKIISASTTTDQDELNTLIGEAIQTEQSLLEPLTKNPSLTAEQMRQIIGHIDERTAALSLKHHLGDEEFATLIYTTSFDQAVSMDGWKAFPDKSRGKLIVLDHCITQWYKEGSTSYYSTTSRRLSDVSNLLKETEHLDSLPWGFVKGQMESYNAERYVGLVTKLQTELLGNDMKKWETAEVLANDFTGSVRELFTTASKL
jgi:hypothetical protein